MNLKYSTFLIFFIVLFSSSCTLYTDMPLKKPAELNNIRNIKKVAIINRTGITQNNNQAENVLEGILTGESVFADRDGAVKCTQGLYDCLLKSLNYDSIVLVHQVFIGNSVTNFPNRFSVKFIDSLAKSLKVDAIASLEYFDSNNGISTILNGAINPVMVRNNPAGNNNNMVIKTGWRFYDSTGGIIDEFRGQTWSSYSQYPYGWNRYDYVRNYGLVSGTGYMAGINHAFRISEQWVVQRRPYFKGGNRAMKSASNFARLGDWELAFELWEQCALSNSRKIRARALHNLAVYYERKGDLIKAKEKANASFSIKHYNQTSQEIFFLNQRMADEQRLISNSKN